MTSPARTATPAYHDGRLDAPACERNREPILQVLSQVLPDHGLVLEIAAGTGQHAVFFSAAFPHLAWQPTDAKASHLASIDAWADAYRADGVALAQLRPARALNTQDLPWTFLRADAILCVNMIHISPWEATTALMQGAGDILPVGGVLITYGPYTIEGAQTAPSNATFEKWLKDKDPRYGIRDIADVTAEANRNGLALEKTIPMPANNFSLIFRKG